MDGYSSFLLKSDISLGIYLVKISLAKGNDSCIADRCERNKWRRPISFTRHFFLPVFIYATKIPLFFALFCSDRPPSWLKAWQAPLFSVSFFASHIFVGNFDRNEWTNENTSSRWRTAWTAKRLHQFNKE